MKGPACLGPFLQSSDSCWCIEWLRSWVAKPIVLLQSSCLCTYLSTCVGQNPILDDYNPNSPPFLVYSCRSLCIHVEFSTKKTYNQYNVYIYIYIRIYQCIYYVYTCIWLYYSIFIITLFRRKCWSHLITIAHLLQPRHLRDSAPSHSGSAVWSGSVAATGASFKSFGDTIGSWL